MPKRSFTYLHTGAQPPIRTYQTAEHERRAQIWQLVQGMRRITVRNLAVVLDILPPAAQELVRGAIAAFSETPCERNRHLRNFFAGKLHPHYVLNDRIALALSEWIRIQGPHSVSEHKRMVSKKVYGVPDPFGLALDFCTLVALRLEKVPFASSFNREGYLRVVQVGPVRRARCR